MITGKNESKSLTKDMSCQSKCRFDGKNVIHINGGITTNVYPSEKDYIVKVYMKKTIFGILLHVISKMENI